MRKITIALGMLAFLAVGCGVLKKIHTGTTNPPVLTIDHFVGEWRSEFILNPEDLTDDFINSSFELRLAKDKIKENALKGWHCSVVRGGRRIDCAEEEPSLHGYLKNDTVYLHFVSSWDVEGEAKLYLDQSAQNQSTVIWVLGGFKNTPQGYEVRGENMEHYMPVTDTLQRVVQGAQMILPDNSTPVNQKRVARIQAVMAEINALPLKCDTLHYRPLERYVPFELFESIAFDNKGHVRKYFWNNDCHDGAHENTTISAYYNEKGKLIYISYESGSNCESTSESYWVHNGRIVDFNAEFYCGCCEDTNDMLTERQVINRRPKIGSVLTKTIDCETPLTDFMNTHSLLKMLNRKERHGLFDDEEREILEPNE